MASWKPAWNCRSSVTWLWKPILHRLYGLNVRRPHRLVSRNPKLNAGIISSGFLKSNRDSIASTKVEISQKKWKRRPWQKSRMTHIDQTPATSWHFPARLDMYQLTIQLGESGRAAFPYVVVHSSHLLQALLSRSSIPGQEPVWSSTSPSRALLCSFLFFPFFNLHSLSCYL
jgi:hypothetical protein